MGETVNDKELAMTLLASLPEEFKPLITALDAVGEDNISFEKVKGMLLNDNDRMCDAKKHEDAFSARRGSIYTKSEVPEKTFNGTCHFCHERGHFARDCRKRKAKQNAQKNEKERKGAAHCAENENNENATDHEEALITSNVADMSDWIIDSGATQHMTFEKNRLTDYIEFKQPCKVNLGDNRTILAYGKGTFSLVADLNGQSQNIGLREVLFLPELEKNLLSVRAMVKLGASVTFEGDMCKITRNSKLLAAGETCGKLYVLKVIPEKEDVNVAKEESNLNLWHCRFGHLGMENISKLMNGNMVDGMKTTTDNVRGTCESCVMGKQHRTAYPKEIPYRAV